MQPPGTPESVSRTFIVPFPVDQLGKDPGLRVLCGGVWITDATDVAPTGMLRRFRMMGPLKMGVLPKVRFALCLYRVDDSPRNLKMSFAGR
jgi:hypothetical protein